MWPGTLQPVNSIRHITIAVANAIFEVCGVTPMAKAYRVCAMRSVLCEKLTHVVIRRRSLHPPPHLACVLDSQFVSMLLCPLCEADCAIECVFL